MRDIESIIKEAKVWGNARNIAHELISVSSNYIYKVEADGLVYALRVDGEQKDFMNLDRSGEVQAIRKASEIGVTPKILTDEDDKVYMITEYIEGGYIDGEKMRRADYIKKMAKILIQIHSIDGGNRECSPFYLLERYLDGIKSLNARVPDGFDEILRKTDEIGKRYAENIKYTKRYCHNDYFTFNMIETEWQIYIIDWELSGFGNLFFDLSTLSFSGMYSDSEDEILLKSYFGYVEDEHKVLLNDMKYMNMLRDIGWLLLHAGLDKENAERYFLPTAVEAIKNVSNGHLHFRCNCRE